METVASNALDRHDDWRETSGLASD